MQIQILVNAYLMHENKTHNACCFFPLYFTKRAVLIEIIDTERKLFHRINLMVKIFSYFYFARNQRLERLIVKLSIIVEIIIQKMIYGK